MGRMTNTIQRLRSRPVATKLIAFGLMATAIGIASAIRTHSVQADPEPNAFERRAELIVGPDTFNESCNECHKVETRSWSMTAHQQSFDTMHSTDTAKAIAKKMGERSVKRSQLCASCHYTTKADGRLKPMWGVSCESCHGPARDFVDIHPHIAGDMERKSMRPGEAKHLETPEQRRDRLALAKDNGMIHTGMVYELARTCIECHLVPNSKLVDVGGHPTDDDFEMVEWMNGSVRHNFVSSEDGKANAPMPPARKRLFYVVGTMVDLEITIKCFEMTKDPGPFKDAMISRANRLIERINTIREATPLAEFDDILADLPPKFMRDTRLPSGLSERIGKVTRTFAETNDGSDLHKIDAILPDENQAVGQPYGPVP